MPLCGHGASLKNNFKIRLILQQYLATYSILNVSDLFALSFAQVKVLVLAREEETDKGGTRGTNAVPVRQSPKVRTT